jgi:hypothetical protein
MNEAQSLNQTLTVLNTKSEFPASIAMPKEIIKEREKTEDHFLKGVFTESLIETER